MNTHRRSSSWTIVVVAVLAAVAIVLAAQAGSPTPWAEKLVNAAVAGVASGLAGLVAKRRIARWVASSARARGAQGTAESLER